MEAILTTAAPLQRKWEQRWVSAILCYCLANFFFPQLEKIFFWGELFAFLTALLLITKTFSVQNYQRPILLLMAIWVFLMPVYAILISKLFWSGVFIPIYAMRHAVYFYYAVFFFFAYRYAYLILYYIKKGGVWLFAWTLFATVYLKQLCAGTEAVFGISLMALSHKKERFYFWGYALILLALITLSGSGTNKYVFGLFLFFPAFCFLFRQLYLWLPAGVNRLLLSIIVAIGLVVFFNLFTFFYDLTTQLALMGKTISGLQELSEDIFTDLGGIWRLTLWSHLYGRLLDFPLGLGIGTPLFEPWLDGFVMLNFQEPWRNYLQGAHNSFVTLIARLGLPALIFFGCLSYCVFQLIKKVLTKLAFQPLQTESGRLLSGALLGFISVVFSASFNVLLESPQTAGNFWFIFGLMTRFFGDFIVQEST